MGRLSNEAKAEKARQSLIETIAAIDDLEPTLGGKWKRGMVAYYTNRLAELLLYQSGVSHPSKIAVEAGQAGLYASLGVETEMG